MDWTLVSQGIGEQSIHKANEQVYIYIYKVQRIEIF